MPNVPLRRIRLQPVAAAQSAVIRAAVTPDQIRHVEAWNLQEPGNGRSWALVRLATRDGVEGWGESRPLTRDALRQLREMVFDVPASAYEALRSKLGARPGAAAVNIAALDILGKMAKAPVYQVLGGPTRNKVRAYTVLHGTDGSSLLKDLERCRDAGFKAFGAPVTVPPFRNSGKSFVNAAHASLEQLYKAVGDDCDFVLQGQARLTPGDAASLAAAFERMHLLWFDEPCSTASIGALRKLAEENVVPLGFGQDIADAAHFQNLLRDDAIDIVRPELSLHGISGVRKIAALAETYYVAVAPRHSQGPVNTAAALHLAASLPNFFIQQIPCPAEPARAEMRAALTSSNIEKVNDGYAALSNAPGLGVTINRQALSKYGEAIA